MREEQIKNIAVTNFQVASAFTRDNSKHGGSMILSRNGVKYKELIKIKKLSIEKHIEVSAIHETDTDTFFLCIYRPPTGDFDLFCKQLDIALGLLEFEEQKNIIITGDFNINFIAESNEKQGLLELVESHGLHVVFDEPSRVTQTSATCIDNVFTNIDPCLYNKYTVAFICLITFPRKWN